MTVLEKIKRCVSLVWDFQEFYGEEDIEDFCCNELDTYTKHNEILDYFKRITDLEKENAELKKSCQIQVDSAFQMIYEKDDQLTKATEIIKKLYAVYYDPCVTESDLKYRDELFAEIKQFLSEVENV